MTEVINVQITTNCDFKAEKIQHRDVEFSLEIHEIFLANSNYLNSKSLQVFVFNTIHNNPKNLDKFNFLEYNNIHSKPLIVEFGREEDTFSKSLFKRPNHYLFFKNENFVKTSEFKDKLVEMALENEEVLESTIVNSDFSEFLNTGKVEKRVLKEFCLDRSLDFDHCVEILKASNNIFEYSGEYYFIHDKSINFLEKLMKYIFKSQNNFLNRNELETIFENDVGIAVEFLESKNILIKNLEHYIYSYDLSYLSTSDDIYSSKYVSLNTGHEEAPKDINLLINMEIKTPFPEFLKQFSKDRLITKLYYNLAVIDYDSCIVLEKDRVLMFFYDEYDLDLIRKVLESNQFSSLRIRISNNHNFYVEDIVGFVENKETKYLKTTIKKIQRQLNDFRDIAQTVYPFIK